jgi:hypothetical protein
MSKIDEETLKKLSPVADNAPAKKEEEKKEE